MIKSIIATIIADLRILNQETIKAVQGDQKSRYIKIILTDGTKPYKLEDYVSAKLYGNPGDNTVLIDCEITGENTLLAEITPAMAAVVGKTEYEIQLYGADNERLSTIGLIIDVQPSISATGVTASDDFQTLTNMISQFGTVQELTVRSEAAKAGAEAQANLAKGYADDSSASKAAAAQSAKESAESASESSGYADTVKQAAQDYLAMLGVDVATLVGGKIPMSQIPATATQEIYEISSESELAGLVAQRGDLAEIVETIDGARTVTKTYQLLGDGDATVRDNWVVWGTSYAVQSGNATNAENAVNATKVGGVPIRVYATYEEAMAAVRDANTVYIFPYGGE